MKLTSALATASVLVTVLFATGARRDDGFGDHIGNYNFRVEISGVEAGAFAEVSGLDAETEFIEYQDGTDLILFHQKKTSPEALTAANLIVELAFQRAAQQGHDARASALGNFGNALVEATPFFVPEVDDEVVLFWSNGTDSGSVSLSAFLPPPPPNG